MRERENINSGEGIVKKKLSRLLWVSLAFLSACTQFDSMLYQPPQTGIDWLNHQPYMFVTLAGWEFILVQPSSTFFVYLLGILTVVFGFIFIKNANHHQSQRLWGIAFVFWGIGALLAGTSYQAFSYEIKCAGREFCLWTSWWEVLYMVFSAASVNTMVLAVSFSSTDGGLRKKMQIYAVGNFAAYLLTVLVGTLISVKFLISFELMLIFLAPSILFLLVFNLRQYFNDKRDLDLKYAVTWIGLGLVILIYFLYLILGFTPVLWKRGIWFSENDLLHIGLIFWMTYLTFNVRREIRDFSTP